MSAVQPEDLGAEMSLFEHLTELRKRLIYGLVAVFVGAGFCWFFHRQIFVFIQAPLVAAFDADGPVLHIKDPTEAFFTALKASVTGGVFLTLPVLFFHVWRFIAPGLYTHERRLALPFIFLATIFFLVGAGFCYYAVLPLGLTFLLAFSQEIAEPTLMVREYYGFVLKLLLAFGAVFEMPVIAMFLSALGVITHRMLIKHWRMAVIGSFVFAALLTPPDVLTQLAMAVPLISLYGVSIGVAYFFTVRREAREARELDDL